MELIRILNADVEADPSNAESWFGLSIAYMYLGQFDEAMEATLSAERADPRDPRFPDQLGEILIELGRLDDAIGAFERAVALDPGLFFPHLRLGELNLETGRTVPAIRHLLDAREIRDWDPQVRQLLGRAYADDGQVENALTAYDEARLLAPAEESIYLEMADVYFTASMADEARRVLDDALELFPYSAQVQLGLARLEIETGNLTDAIARFESALGTGAPDLPLAAIYQSMGDVHFDLMDPDRALAAYDRAIAEDPSRVEAHIGKAEIFTSGNDLAAARAAYARAAGVAPANAEVQAGLASTALMAGDAAAALEAAETALELDPTYRQALYFRGQALVLLGDEDGGRRDIEDFARREAAAEAEQQRIRELQAMNREALDHLDAGMFTEAIAILEEAILRFPGEQLLHANLAAAFSRSNRHEDAAATYRGMIDEGIADAITHLRLSWELETLGDLDGSARHRATYEELRASESRPASP